MTSETTRRLDAVAGVVPGRAKDGAPTPRYTVSAGAVTDTEAALTRHAVLLGFISYDHAMIVVDEVSAMEDGPSLAGNPAIEYPIIYVPMAGGQTTPELVAAMSDAGGQCSFGAVSLFGASADGSCGDDNGDAGAWMRDA